MFIVMELKIGYLKMAFHFVVGKAVNSHYINDLLRRGDCQYDNIYQIIIP